MGTLDVQVGIKNASETLNMKDARQNYRARSTSAFTLIEVLVVLGIVAILASISLVVANRVTEGGRERLTTDLLKTLDTAAQSVIGQAGKIPATYTDVKGNEFPLIDARGSANGTIGTARVGAYNPTDGAPGNASEPSLAMFILAASKFTSFEDAIKGIETKYILRNRPEEFEPQTASNPYGNPYGFTWPQSRHLSWLYSPTLDLIPIKDPTASSPQPGMASQVEMGLSLKDAWGQPIRFVHPAYHGGYGSGFQLQGDGTLVAASNRSNTSELRKKLKQSGGTDRTVSFRRSARPTGSTTDNSIGDADEGLCAGTMPYFYSTGPDKNAGTRTDNVYTTKPTYPAETRDKN